MIGSLLGVIAASSIQKTAECITSAALTGFEAYTDSLKEIKKLDLDMKRMETAANRNPDDFVQMGAEHDDFIDQDFREVVRNLSGMGFYDINIRNIFVKKGRLQHDRTGMVTGVTINGTREFDSSSIFPKTSHVVVEAVVHNREESLFMPELIEIRKGSVAQKKPVLRCAYCETRVSVGQKYCIGCGAPI